MKATCRKCENDAMGCADMEEAALAVMGIEWGNPVSAMLECVYCGDRRRSRDEDEISWAYHNNGNLRRLWGKRLAEEREKVARLQEGRW